MVLNNEFVALTEAFKNELSGIKAYFDGLKKTNYPKEKLISLIGDKGKEFFPKWDSHFFKIWDIYEKLSEADKKSHQKYYQEKLVPFFIGSPYNKRVYEKPLGYAGDYVMMLYLYEDEYEGSSLFDVLIHRYSMRVPSARANHNRKNFYKTHIENTLKEFGKNASITSVASGPAVEILEILQENPEAGMAKFYCIDFEKEALAYVNDKVKLIEKKLNKKFALNLINLNILNFIKGSAIKNIIPSQKLIYCSGLIDYFSDRAAAKIIKNFSKLLDKGGTLIFGNVNEPDKFRAYTEILGEWNIQRRGGKSMLDLVNDIKDGFEAKIEYENETRMNVFLILKKK